MHRPSALPEPAVAQRMPPRAPRRMPAQPVSARRRPRRDAGRSAQVLPRLWLAAATLGLAGGLVWAMAQALLPDGPTPAALTVLALYGVAVLWTGLAAATALLGLMRPDAPETAPPAGWRPYGRTAILILTCGEPPLPVVRQARALRRDLDRAGLGAGPGAGAAEVFLLSDSRGAAARAEARAFAALAGLPGVWWRQRATNIGRKPGNIADWVTGWGGAWDYMLVLDADSRMSAARIARLIRRMEASPGTGLLQAGMRLVPARTRFGALQRLSGRLGGPGFGRGLAAWAGGDGNYWGHNALIRVAAFAAAAGLPDLPGRAPRGGAILSHDFVEAAFLRRAGWAVDLAPDFRGSFEDGPQRLAPFHRRERRWCQGNLQHLRLLTAPGLHPASRMHLACGILGYLAAPVWLGLVLVLALSGAAPATLVPLAGGLALLAVPKLAGAALWLARARTWRRRAVVLRAAVAELALSSLLAPVMMLRQSLAVAAVALGRDCGWQPAGDAAAARIGRLAGNGWGEATAGLLLAAAVTATTGPAALALLAPVLVPLILAPALAPWLERPLRRGAALRRVQAVAADALPPVPARQRIAA